MAKYIDADELIAALQPAKNSEWNKNDHSASRSEMIADFCTELENWRTADVAPKSEVAREIFAEIEIEIREALDSNYKARKMRLENKHEKQKIPPCYCDDGFICICDGKITALRGIESFLSELKKKYTEE